MHEETRPVKFHGVGSRPGRRSTRAAVGGKAAARAGWLLVVVATPATLGGRGGASSGLRRRPTA